MKEMCKIVHNQYDKVTDKVMWLGMRAVLNFNVELFYHRKDISTGNKIKENYHKEIMYNQNGLDKVKILRDFSYYFTIEYNEKDIKEKCVVGTNDIYYIIFNIKRVMDWFIGNNGVNQIFSQRKDGTLFIPTHPEPVKVLCSFGSYIEFEPSIGIIDGYEKVGVRVFINRDDVSFFMLPEALFGLYNMLSTCNMYTMATNILNYISRPDPGTNMYNINTGENNIYKETNTQNGFFARVGAKVR